MISIKRLLVFRLGFLGDTLVALPALAAVRSAFPQATITLLCDRVQHGDAQHNQTWAGDVLEGSGLVDDFLVLGKHNRSQSAMSQPMREVRLWQRLRRGRFDGLVYLEHNRRSRWQRVRDLFFFRSTGISRIWGLRGYPSLPRGRGVPGRMALVRVEREGTLLLRRLEREGLGVPVQPSADGWLSLNTCDELEAYRWRRTLAIDGGRPWVAIGPFSNMPAKVWPHERLIEAVGTLIRRFDVQPVVFGGAGDRDGVLDMTRRWGRGHVAAGGLGVRASAVVMRGCAMYLGNDTGAMHLAACVGLPCVAVFSSRDLPGLWEPTGVGHTVLRSDVPCANCQLTSCHEHAMRCMKEIGVARVVEACERTLSRVLPGREYPLPVVPSGA